jgi:hypothetical protein
VVTKILQWRVKFRLAAGDFRGGLVMMAQIAMLRALTHGKEPPAEQPRKLAKKCEIVSE